MSQYNNDIMGSAILSQGLTTVVRLWCMKVNTDWLGGVTHLSGCQLHERSMMARQLHMYTILF